MEHVEAVLTRERDWILDQIATEADPTLGRSVYSGFDHNSAPAIFVLASDLSAGLREKICLRVRVPVEFVDCNIRLE
jgi:hypothetical protein